jgi:hypothetical protein
MQIGENNYPVPGNYIDDSIVPGNMSPLPGHQTQFPEEKRRERFIDTLGLGFFLWFLGYIASIILFFLVPSELIGWILFVVFTPVFIVITLARFRKRLLPSWYYMVVSVTWTGIAIIFDFLFIVKLFKPDNYYHLSVLLYYLETFLVPLITGILYRSDA